MDLLRDTAGATAARRGGGALTPARRRSGPLVAMVLIGLAGVPGQVLFAQTRPLGSRLLETDHWADEYLRRLRSQGYLPGLDPLAQPYTRSEVTRGLAALMPDTLPEPAASWVRLLRAEFAGELAPGRSPRVGAVVLGGVRGATSQRLDELRPMSPGGVWPWGEVGGWFASGPLTAETRVLGDTYLRRDPDGRAPGLRVAGLSDHTYLSLAAGPADIVLGRLTRNWAPPGTHGLLLSDNPLGYPQLGLDVRLGRFALQAFNAELDTLAANHRYLAANRVAYVGRTLTVAFMESILYSAGNAGPSWQLLNPFTVLLFEHENPPAEDRAENLMLGAQLWYRAGKFDFYGEGLLDDIDVRPDSGLSRAPTRYGLTLGARWRPFGPVAEASAEYQRGSAYAFRSYRAQDRYDYLSRGLGTNFADYDRLSLAVDLFPPISGLRLTPAAQLLRQGQGDLRTPFPSDATFRNSPAMFLGVVERTYRLALRGRYQPRPQLWVTVDIGQNLVRNAGHVAGASDTKFVALGAMGLRFHFGPRSR